MLLLAWRTPRAEAGADIEGGLDAASDMVHTARPFTLIQRRVLVGLRCSKKRVLCRVLPVVIVRTFPLPALLV